MGRAADDSGFVVAVAAVIVRREGGVERVLAMRRAPSKDAAPGIWETCSGRVEDGEQPLDALAREVIEETGLEVAIGERPVDAYATRRRERPMIVIVYRAEWLAGEVRRSDEHDAHAWWTLEEVEASAASERGMPPRLARAVLRALAAPAAQPTS